MSFLSGRTSLTTVQTGDLADDAVTLAKMAHGTASQNIAYDGSGIPVDVAAAGGGAWNFISSATASASANVAFTSGIDSTYDLYILTVTDFLPATDGEELLFTVSTDGGGSYHSADYQYHTNNSSSGAGAFAGTSSASNTSIKLVAGAGLGNVSGEGLSFVMKLFNPSGTALHKKFSWTGTRSIADGNTGECNGSGSHKATTDVDAVKFTMTSGNITSGVFRLYGVADA